MGCLTVWSSLVITKGIEEVRPWCGVPNRDSYVMLRTLVVPSFEEVSIRDRRVSHYLEETTRIHGVPLSVVSDRKPEGRGCHGSYGSNGWLEGDDHLVENEAIESDPFERFS
ncbi:hypothetical protein CR513_62149, partial [Mucuna pruriens]